MSIKAIYVDIFMGVNMDNNSGFKLPLAFQMALAHNPKSMNAFLNMDIDKQDKIVNEAWKIETKREMQMLVDGLSVQ